MQSDRHAAVIARDCWNSKALFAQSLRRVDFLRRGGTFFGGNGFCGQDGCCPAFLANGRPLDF
jgi:hypothetical protein